MKNSKWEQVTVWCEAHGFKWAIVNNRLYWQTNCQTAKMDENGGMTWHDKKHFDEVTKA